MAVLALFQPDSATRARLHDALAPDHELVTCESWSELWESLLRDRADGAVIDPYSSFDPVSLPELLHLRRRFPGMAIVVFADFHGRELDLYHLGRLGVDGVILAEEEHGLRKIRDAVEMALGDSLAKRVGDTLEGVVSSTGIRCVEWAVRHAEESPQVRDLARAVRTSPRALARELRDEGLPSPRHILLWGRLLQAARLLEAEDVTVEEVAFRLGYATGASLGRALKEQTGLSPTELVDAGGVERVLASFLNACGDALREAARDRRWSTSSARKALLRSFLDDA